MKRKFVAALLLTMTLSLGTAGTVFATAENTAATAESTTDEHEGMVWVVDKEAVYDTVIHPEEGHFESVLVSEEEGHYETVVTEPEEGHYENVLVSEEEGHYETQQVQVGTEPVYETQVHAFCLTCDMDLGIADDPEWGGWAEGVMDHILWHSQNDPGNCRLARRNVDVQVGEKPVYEDKQVWVVDKEAVYEDQWVVDKPAVTEEQWVVDKEAVYEDQWIVDKEAWTEQVLVSPEEGHWEPAKAETSDPEEPTVPENPDTEVPEEPETPNPEDSVSDETETPSTSVSDQTEAPASDNAQTNNTETVNDTESSQNTNNVPQTGDPTSLGWLISFVGSALAGSSALVRKFRKKQ